MILRRFMKHVTDQNWFAVGLDVIVVIVGIFIGLQATGWTERQAERAEEQFYSSNIEKDILASLELAKLDLELSKTTIESIQYLLPEFDKSELLDNKEQIDQAVFYAMYNIIPMATQNSTYAEMVSSGKLSLLKNNALRTKLVSLTQTISNIRYQDKNIYDLVTANIDPILITLYGANNFLRYENAVHNPYVNDDIFKNTPPEGLITLLNNARAKNALYYRLAIQSFKLNLIEQLITEYEEILKLIPQQKNT